MKPVQRNYAFDKRAEGVPEHAQYLKIKYPAKCTYIFSFTRFCFPFFSNHHISSVPALARELNGHTFSHVFGTKSSCTELLLVKRSMMGPCWITLTHLTKPQQPSTFCKVEYVLESLKHMEDQFIPDPNDAEAPPKKTRVSVKHVNRMENAPDAPPLNVLSLHIQTIHNTKKHHHEVVAISAVSHRAVSIDGPTSDFKSVSAFTAVRKIEGQAFPPDLPLQIQQKQRPIELCNNEAALLNFFLAKVQNLDPDVLVGHGLHGFPMEVLMSRFDACSAVLPTRIGRLQRRNLMQRFKGAKGKAGARFSYADVAAGRLVMDTEISAKELVHEKTYTLTELAKTQLKITRDELDAAIVPYLFGTSFDIMDRLVKRCETDAWLTLQLMFKLMIVPLTKQLTELCGNLWARSLQAQRAERNEYLLLHKFHSLKYICPDKLSFAERQEAIASKREKAKASKAAAAKSLKRKAAADQAEMAAGEDGAAIPDAEELQADMPPEEEDFEVAGDDDDDDTEATNSRGRRKKPAYSGGLVLEPKKGFYDKIVLVLDFNSLYPSIIQEYNLCFTTVEHWRVNEHGVPEVPPTGRANGVLPRVLRTLVERRRAVKGLLKNERDPIKAAQLEIKQKAFKLVANSMYGCLGFGSSRFCCMPIAALITAQGRDILQRTVDLVQGSLSLNVIYGDTDSLFVYTNTNDLREARDIGGRIKRDVNKLYKLLEIDLDHVFKSLLLLKKKKYAALVDEGDGSAPHIESKGLDLVRRDWCDLSKDLGNIVLQEVMSGRSAEDIVDAIHGHLRQLSDDIRANRIPLQKFIINKGLTKNPADYPDAKNQPHVQVALAMLKAGKAVKSGDFVPYVICIDQANPDNVGGGLLGARAHHPDAVMASNGALTVDTRWYLSNQVLPPIVRLCDPIQGTDAAQIAECLGLDSSKFSHFTSQPSEMEIDELAPSLDNVLDDDERFKECAPLLLSCRHCNVQNVPFAGVFARTPPPKGYAPNQPDMSLIRSGLHCGTAGCPGFVCQSPSCRPRSFLTR
jgi:DNA polymerase alpha subunit A